jgi:hypothetical protein
MKINRSEYIANQSIIDGFKPRYMATTPKGKARAFNLIIWLLVGFCIPFMALGVISHYHKSECHSKALATAGKVGTDHYYQELGKCSK